MCMGKTRNMSFKESICFGEASLQRNGRKERKEKIEQFSLVEI